MYLPYLTYLLYLTLHLQIAPPFLPTDHVHSFVFDVRKSANFKAVLVQNNKQLQDCNKKQSGGLCDNSKLFSLLQKNWTYSASNTGYTDSRPSHDRHCISPPDDRISSPNPEEKYISLYDFPPTVCSLLQRTAQEESCDGIAIA